MKRIPFFKSTAMWICSAIILSITSQCTDESIVTPTSSAVDSISTSALAITEVPLSCSSCTYVVPANKIAVDGNVLSFKPGDVICLNAASTYTTIAFNNIVGTAENPIIIRNCGGTVNINAAGNGFAIRMQNSKHFRITGGSTDNNYGIKCVGSTSSGVILGYLTSDYEVDHIEISNTGFAGMMAKTDPNCNVDTQRGYYTMRNVSIHHNYVHDTGGEGFYLGHSSYNGVNNSTCGLIYPHTIENIRVYRNRVSRSGWDAIQLSSATKGAQIFANNIDHYGVANKSGQNGGICIGGGTGGVCYGNFINTGSGPGMSVFGLANNLVHNNIIVAAGAMGIFCDERTPTVGAGYKFVNNTIINPKTEGIKIYSEKVPMNVVCNNIIVNPGSYSVSGSRAYISTLSSSVPLESKNNYNTTNINELKFYNIGANNFRLTAYSPTVDQGCSIADYNIGRDFYASSRYKGLQYDIGASEY